MREQNHCLPLHLIPYHFYHPRTKWCLDCQVKAKQRFGNWRKQIDNPVWKPHLLGSSPALTMLIARDQERRSKDREGPPVKVQGTVFAHNSHRADFKCIVLKINFEVDKIIKLQLSWLPVFFSVIIRRFGTTEICHFCLEKKVNTSVLQYKAIFLN